MTESNRQSPWQAELDDVLRGVAGALLFGAPFLYTMEVWWKGNFVSPAQMMVMLLLTYLVLVGLNRVAGFRQEQDRTWLHSLGDGAEALALGLITATLSLSLLNLLGPDMGLEAALGRIVMEGVPFALGVGIANTLLYGKADDGGDRSGDSGHEENARQGKPLWNETLADAGATALGAVIIAFSIAPTDEIPLIAGGLSYPWLLAVMAASLLLSYIIVFEADLVSKEDRLAQRGLFQSPLSETIISYLISLFVAVVMLWLFQLLRFGDPLSQWVHYAVVLAFPATIGGAAGRLAV